MTDELNQVRIAYLALLLLPLSSTTRHTLEIQAAMANLRDYIALATGEDRERVQNGMQATADIVRSDDRPFMGFHA